MLESSQDGMKRVRRVLLTNVSSSEGTIQLQPVSSFLSPWICSICCCTSICSSLSQVKAQYKWADITRPQARGFLQIETDSGDADKEQKNGNSLNRMRCKKTGLQKLGEWWTASAAVFGSQAPRRSLYSETEQCGSLSISGVPIYFLSIQNQMLL